VDISDPGQATFFLSFSNLSWKVTRLVGPEGDFDLAKPQSNTGSGAAATGQTAKTAQTGQPAQLVIGESATTHMNNGVVLARKGEYGAALAELDRAIALDPKSSRAYAWRGYVYRWRNEYDRALADVNEAIRLDSKNANALSIRGAVLSIKGDNDKAVADVTAAIRLSPNESVYWNNRGFVYNNKNDYDLAIDDLNEAIRLDSKSAFAYKNRGTSYEKKNQLQKALNDYESAVQINPKLQEAIDGARRVNQLLAVSSGSQQTADAGQIAPPQASPSQQTADAGQTASSPASPPPRIAGADLYIDLAQYSGRPVILTDGTVQGANNYGALIAAHGVSFNTTGGIDRESFRFFLKNCTGFAQDNCKIPILVTPTGEKPSGLPQLKDVKMIQ
jgi:tetratricopeptide (TPR) repeat protein